MALCTPDFKYNLAVVEQLREELPKVFPDRKYEVKKDGNVYKIIGDFYLGEI